MRAAPGRRNKELVKAAPCIAIRLWDVANMLACCERRRKVVPNDLMVFTPALQNVDARLLFGCLLIQCIVML